MRGGWAAMLVGIYLAGVGSCPGGEASVVGKLAPEWRLTDWLNSTPIALKELRGKAVLVRWWTAPGCKYCRATAPALNEFHARYAQEGLQVIGVYHHKSDEPLDVREVKKHADRLGFKFPVAVDRDWRTLEEWWLKDNERGWTSVTFLIDRKGLVRYVHPGGSYAKGDADYDELKKQIEKALEK